MSILIYILYEHIINILNVKVKKFCISLLESAGSFAYTRGVMAELDTSIRAEVERLGGNQTLMEVLDQLKDWEED